MKSRQHHNLNKNVRTNSGQLIKTGGNSCSPKRNKQFLLTMTSDIHCVHVMQKIVNKSRPMISVYLKLTTSINVEHFIGQIYRRNLIMFIHNMITSISLSKWWLQLCLLEHLLQEANAHDRLECYIFIWQ